MFLYFDIILGDSNKILLHFTKKKKNIEYFIHHND